MGFVIVATEASRTMLRDSKIRQVSPQDRKGRFAALVSPRKPCRSWITAETLLALGRCLEDCRGTHRTGAAPEISAKGHPMPKLLPPPALSQMGLLPPQTPQQMVAQDIAVQQCHQSLEAIVTKYHQLKSLEE
ncbi:uncharacterized protein LOC144829388 isoform X2 [Lissotriton helveticus]